MTRTNTPSTSDSSSKEIVFIDQAIDDYQSLVNGIKSGIEFHMLESTQDGVLQITNILNQRSDISAIHIVSHGNIGYLSLGNSVLSTDTLSKYQQALFSWQIGLKQNADILIYGCNVAKGLIGQQFIQQLAELTGANIAASDNLTGNSAIGGDWKLGASTGNIVPELAFREEHLKQFSSTFVTNTLDFTTDTVAASVTATHPTTNFGTISLKLVNNVASTGTANGSLTLAATGAVNDADNDFYYSGTDGTYLVIYTDGREVDFQSVKLGSIGATIYTDITGYAYKDGSLLGNQTINPAGANFPNDGVSITPETITFTNAIFENADEIRLTGTNNFGNDVGQLLIDDLILADAVPANTTPAISIDNASLAYTENAAATQADAAATLTDADGDADWNGGTLVAQITGNNEAADRLSIVDNAVGTINTSGTNILNGATVIGTLSASEGTVTNGTALTVTFNANATNALVQQVVRAIHYDNTSNDPGTSNRTITFTATDTNAASANDTRTVTVTAVNNEPTLTTTASNPTFTEGGAAASLFSGSAVSTVESGQTLTGFTLTVTNLADGSSEILNADGTAIALTNANAGTTATNSLSYSVSVTGSTATATFSGGTVSTAAMQTLVNAISYQNNSADPGTSNRVVTLTSLIDSGSNTGSNDNVAALAVASTVTMTALNDEPTLTATGSNPTFTEGGAAASLFSGSAVSTVESGQTLTGFTLTVTNLADGSSEILNADGTAIVLTNGTSGTTATNSLSYSVSVTGSTATVTLSGGTVSTAATQTLVNSISYQNNSGAPNTSNRVVTITSATDSGSNTGSNDNVAALAVSSTVTVAASPAITSATYDYNTNQLVVTGINFVAQAGAANDVDISLLTIKGEGNASYTLTSAVDVEIDSATQFTITLSGADIYNVEALLNKDGSLSDDATTFNLAAADNWMTGTSATPDISDAINGITVSNVAAPAVTSATYDASTGVVVISGTNFVNKSGAANDLDASLLTFTGEAGATYTLTDTSEVELTSAASATVTLSSTDQLNIQGLLNKAGLASGDATTYNLAVADNWLPGAPATTNIADLTSNGVTVSNIQTPTVTSATYDSDTGVMVVTGTNLFKKDDVTNDVDISTLTLTGGTANATYTITSASDVEITSATSFSVTLIGSDKTNVDALLDQIGTSSSGGSTYNLAAADDWLASTDAATNIADATNAVTVSINPKIASATYNAATGSLVVTGTNIQANGGGSDIDASTLTFTGEGGATYTLTDSADVERDSVSQFTVTLSATDKAAINLIVNKNGTTSTSATTYNLAAADDWDTNVTAADTSDATGNAITASNVAAPAITSSTYNAGTGSLVVAGTGFLNKSGAANDIDASKLTFTAEGGATYALTDTTDVEITSGTAFTVTLSATDKAALNQIINKNGTTSTDATTYNLAAAEDWSTGADTAVNVVDATGNGVTVSNVAVPAITSSTYNASTGVLVVTGTGFLSKSGAANDIDASLFTFTGEGGGGAAYTLTDSADIEITSGTTFTVTLSATDKASVNLIIEKAGTSSTDATTYNLAAAEDWATGADAAVNVVDATNAITATIAAPAPSGGGGGSSTPTPTTIDGVTTNTTVQSDGTVTTTIPIVEDTRQDDPTTISMDHADIPVTTNSEGDATLIVSIPVGVGLSVDGQPQALSKANAINDLIQRIENKTEAGSDQRVEMTGSGQAFLDSLADDESISVQTIVPTVSDNQKPNVPIVITGSVQAGDDKQALVIDVTNLPSGTVLQLDNVAFIAIVGAVRVVGGAGKNIAIGDNQNQFIVLGADDDILFGGGGDDTVGSLGGNDQTSGDAGNDIVYGGSANDIISGGVGNDQLNGGFGFDIALQEGQQTDYQIMTQGNHIVMTHSNGTIDTLTDAELVRFASGPSLAIAHSATEAAAHHLVKTWLARDLTAVEGNATQDWEQVDVDYILKEFRNLPEAAEFLDKTDDELLAGLDTNPDIIQLNVTRDIIAGAGNDQGFLPLGLALNADGGAGYDVLRMQNNRSDVHLETVGDYLEIINLNDGAMLSITNTEAIAFDSGETVILTHNANEGVLARIVHTFLDRNASVEEWQAGRQALADNAEVEVFFNWFHERTDFDQLSDSEYIQTLFQNTLQRSATTDEVNGYLAQLNDGSLNRDWVAVDIAQSEEAIAVIGSVMTFDGGI